MGDDGRPVFVGDSAGAEPALDWDRLVDLAGAGQSRSRLTSSQVHLAWEATVGHPTAVLHTAPDPDLAAVPRRLELDGSTVLRWLARPEGPPRLLGLRTGGRDVLAVHRGVDDASGDVHLVCSPQVMADLVSDGTAARPVTDGVVVPQEELARHLLLAVVDVGEAPGEALDPEIEQLEVVEPGELPQDIYSPLQLRARSSFGAPLETIWHAVWELEGVHACVVNTDAPPVPTDRIPYVVELDGPQFSGTLAALVRDSDRFIRLLVTLGTSGHTVYVAGAADDGALAIIDPWPGRSLLAAPNNSVGVDVARIPEPPHRALYALEAGDAARIGVAALVPAHRWAQAQGWDVGRDVQELLGSQLLRQYGFGTPTVSHEDGVTTLVLRTAAEGQAVEMEIRTDPASEVVRRVTLTMPHRWAVSSLLSPISTLVPAWVEAVAAELDGPELDGLSRTLSALRRGVAGAEAAAGTGPAHLVPAQRSVLSAVLGHSPFGFLTAFLTTVTVTSGAVSPAGAMTWTVELAPTGVQPLWQFARWGHEMGPERVRLMRDALGRDASGRDRDGDPLAGRPTPTVD